MASTIKLYNYGSHYGLADLSPFVLKVDAYMKFANIPFESSPDYRNPRKAPNGKLPFIIDEGKTISDSEFIIAYLQEKFDVQLDSKLTTKEKSTSYLMGKSLDENLYWCLVYSRWAMDDTWDYIKKAYFSSMPYPLNKIVPLIARKEVVKNLYKQGIGRHSTERVLKLTERSFSALASTLSDKPYFFGNAPSSFDAVAFGILAQFICVPIDNKANNLARNYLNLVQYCERILAEYYPNQ
ncbi:glutathione S-transferase family protein [Cycloclasticus sp. P1]|jgi:glutathione S-transferase|uniref:glutathione S-transferase family protein n=1 Tax=Cycloclasticus sp. (strain P1) TaxID=385025 RepID=UPI000286ACB4|nr:glutathione S-transferase family protein [Cycloclasticus sp. P1]AFT66921.1 Glutathione S-transferase [Cycloclasticus sp. P1]